MVATEVQETIRRLDEAVEPEEVFGAVADAKALRGVYRHFARIVHPDRNDGDEDAARAFRRLTSLARRAEDLIREGTYGADRAPTFRLRTRRREYLVDGRVLAGEVCDVFRCRWDGGRGTAKVARHPRDNDLVQAEAATLRRIRRDVDPRWLPFLPDLVDATGFRAKGGVVRRANVLDDLDGFVSIADVGRRIPEGVQALDMAWIWRRLLSILGAVHRAGITHAGVTPSSVLIHPEKHGLVLADWEYAVPTGTPPRAASRVWRPLYPPELAERRLGPEADVYTAARTMLLDPRALLRAAHRPPQTRGDVAGRGRVEQERAGAEERALVEVARELPRRFRPFVLPTEGRP